jgi:hypothetical protein
MATAVEEGTVDWAGAEVQFGSQAAAGEPAVESDGTVEVRIKGRTVKMSTEAATAYNEFVRDTRERDGRLGGEIAQLRERSARLEGMVETVNRGPAPAAHDIAPPPAKLAIEDFEEWQRQMLQYNGAMMLRQQSELEGKYSKAEAARTSDARTQQWAERFYALNPHLNRPHLRDVVTGVYRRNAQEIDSLNATDSGEAHTRLAELAADEINAIRTDGKTHETTKPPRLEGAGAPSSGAKVAEVPVQRSAADWSARKRAQLRGEKAK